MKEWLSAARPRTLPLALANIAIGASLAYYFDRFSWAVALLTIIAGLLLQILSNFANDYGDSVHGVDHTERIGPVRSVQSGAINATAMKKAMYLLAAMSLVSGVFLLAVAPLSILERGLFLILGLLAIWGAINYTAGSRPYGYRAMGDFSVFLFFGLLSVIGAYYVQGGRWHWSVIWPAVSCGCFSMGVLNINNIRDIDSDLTAGKKSIANILGLRAARHYHSLLITLGVLSSVVFVLTHSGTSWRWLFVMSIPLFIFNVIKVYTTPPESLDPYLRQLALTILLYAIGFVVGHTIA